MDYLSYIDFLSPDITLYFNNKRSHSSKLSYLLTLISILIIIIISVIYSIDFIYRINPNSFFYKTFVDDVGVFPINKISDNNNLSSIFYHFINFDNKQIDKRAFQIIGINEPANIILNNDISEYNHWIYDSCNGTEDIKDFFNYLNEYESIYLNNGLCISKYYDSKLKKIINKNESNFLYPSVAHGNTNKNEIIYLIGIKKCENNTILNNNSCYENEIIENIIKEYKYYSLFFLDHHIDLDNYHYPIKYLFHHIVKPISLDLYSSNYLYFELTSVLSYFGFFYQSKTIFDTFLYYTYQASSNLREGKKKLIGIFIILLNNTKNIYIRKYKMFTDILVFIAGISKVIIFIFKIFYFIPYNITIFNDIKNIINKKYKKYFFTNKILDKLNLNKNYNNYIEKKDDNKINIINEHDISNNNLSNYSNINKNNKLLIQKKSSIFNQNFIDENKNLNEINLIKKLCVFNNYKNRNNFICLFKKNKLIYDQVYKFRKKLLSEEELFLLHMSVIKIKKFLKTDSPKI